VRTISILPLIRPFALAILSGAVAHGTTMYNSVLTIGSGAVDFSLTTDGVTGVLGTNDVLSWSVDISDQYGVSQFSWPQPCSYCIFDLQGSDLTATDTSLSFDFSGSDNGFLDIVDPSFSPAATSAYLEFSIANGLEETVGGFLIPAGPHNRIGESGDVVIASVVPENAAPEPASWALLLPGSIVLITIKARCTKSTPGGIG
jgi:hypothetical protein